MLIRRKLLDSVSHKPRYKPSSCRTVLLLEALESREVPAGSILTEYGFALGDAAGWPGFLTKGPDGNVWYTEPLSGTIARIDDNGQITRYTDPSGLILTPRNLVAGPDGNVWVAEGHTGAIAKVSSDGKFTTFNVLGGTSSIIAGPDGNLWVAGQSQTLGMATPEGSISYYSLSDSPLMIAAGKDGNIWFVGTGYRLSKLNPADGSVTTFAIPHEEPKELDAGGYISSLVAGPDGNMWLAMSRLRYVHVPVGGPEPDGYVFYVDNTGSAALITISRLVRVTPEGSITSFQVPYGVHPDELGVDNEDNIWFTGTSYPDHTTAGRRVQVGRVEADGTISQYLNMAGFNYASSFAFDSSGKLWLGNTGDGKRAALEKIDVANFGKPIITFAPMSVGTLVQGIVSNAIIQEGSQASVSVDWGDGPRTSALLQVVNSDLGTYGFALPRVFGTAGDLQATITVTDANGVRTLFQTTVTITPDPDGQFLTEVYQDLLGRNLDPLGSQVWLGMLDHGSSRGDVVRGIQHSSEYRTHVIDQLYQKYLARHAEAYGLKFFDDYLTTGGTKDGVESAILGSDEYFQMNGGSNDKLVDALYHDLFQRAVDPLAGYWVGLLNDRTSAGAVAGRILQSEEARSVRLDALYQRHLHRNADRLGVEVFTPALLHDHTDASVVLAILSSEEYFSKRAGG